MSESHSPIGWVVACRQMPSFVLIPEASSTRDLADYCSRNGEIYAGTRIVI